MPVQQEMHAAQDSAPAQGPLDTSASGGGTQIPLRASHATAIDADFSFVTSSGKLVSYRGTTRFEQSPADRSVLLSLQELADPRRNVKSEVLELARAVNELRRDLTNYLFSLAPDLREDHQFMIREGRIIDRIYPATLETDLKQRNTPFASAEYQASSERLQKGERTLRMLLEARNSSPELIANIAAERARRLQSALNTLAQEPELSAVLTVQDGYSSIGGVMGRGLLIAEGLLHALPNLHLDFRVKSESLAAAEGSFEVLEHPKLRTNRQSKPGPESGTPLLAIGVWGDLSGSVSNGVVNCDFRPFSYTLDSQIPSFDYLAAPTNNDLMDPCGTLILNGELRTRRQARDRWSLDELAFARTTWRAHAVSKAQNKALEKLALIEGWNPDRAVWSFGYVQRWEKLVDELGNLSGFLRKNGDQIPFSPEGRQILLHVRPGVQVLGSYGELTSRGIRVIDPKGKVHPPAPLEKRRLLSRIPAWLLGEPSSKDCKITVVLHDAIENSACKELVARLTGCAVRDATDSHWVDFPVFVTGSASWLEAVSAGAIAVHDNNDASMNKRPQIEAAIRKQLATSRAENPPAWEETVREASGRAEQHLLASPAHENLYGNLEEWSRLARNFSDAMYRFNSIDDLIIAMAEAVEQRAAAQTAA